MLGMIFKYSGILRSSTDIRLFQGIMHKYFVHDKSIFTTALCIRTFLTRNMRLTDTLVQPAKFLKFKKLPVNISIRRQQTSQFNVNTDVRNNVILYKLESNRYFRYMHLFAIGQLFCCSLLAFYAYTPSFFHIFKPDVELKEYLYKNIYRLGIFGVSITIGPTFYFCIYALSARTVKYIILNKGGKNVTLATYHVLKRKSNMILPVQDIQCTTFRQDLGIYVPLKIKNKFFYYLMDKRGTFINPELFDNTVGLTQF